MTVLLVVVVVIELVLELKSVDVLMDVVVNVIVDVASTVALNVPKVGMTRPCTATLENDVSRASGSAAATTTTMDPGYTSMHAEGAMVAEHSDRKEVLFDTTVS